MEHNRQQLRRELPRKLPRCCSFFVKKRGLILVTVLQSGSIGKDVKSTTGKSVQKAPTMKVMPRSLGTSLSYSLNSFRHKVRFNFGESVAKGIKVKRWKKIDIAFRKGARENFHAVIYVAFQ